MNHVPNLLKHNSILVHYTTYPEGSVERAKALGLNLWSTYRRVESTVGLWETECQIVAKEEAWKPLGVGSLEDYIAAITGKSSVAVEQELFERAEAKKDKGKQGRKSKVIDGDSISYERGTTNENILRRLARDHNGIFEKVKSGELTINQAAIAAGIRKKPSHNDTALKAFRRSQDRTELLRDILSAFITEGGQQALYELQAMVKGLQEESDIDTQKAEAKS